MHTYKLSIYGIISHRQEEYDEYLFKFKSLNNVGVVQNLEYFQNKDVIDGMFYYDVWVKDDLCFTYYRSDPDSNFGIPKCTAQVANKIYDYCRNLGMNFVFYFAKVNKENFPDGDFTVNYHNAIKEQENKAKILRKIYSGYKVIFNKDSNLFYDGYLSRYLDSGDIFFTDLREFPLSETNLMLEFMRRFEGQVLTSPDTFRVMDAYNRYLSLDEFRDMIKDYVAVLDIDTVIRDATISTAVLSMHGRVGKGSALNVLPQHLLRDTCLWF